MKLHTAPADTATMSGVLETKQFNIKTSAHAFQILSSGLYANKIRAIIRELSCNAYDSHVSAGCADVPFDVHLPTALEPYFSVRDYGIGLSHSSVVTIFTTYFDSTKTDSNELIGGLGLGSKAPFSYTNNFTVTAIKDGVKGVYSAFVSDTGVPSIAAMSQGNTSESNGVEIQFAVENRSDFRKFYDEAERVFENFAVYPRFTGHEIVVPAKHYDHKDIAPGIHLRSKKHQNIAVMGNIAYPIDVPNADKLLKELNIFNNIGMEIEFAIGEIEFQASREGLSYTPRTIEAICNKYKQFGESLKPAFLKEVLQKTNMWERTWFIREKLNDGVWKYAAQQYIQHTQYPYLTKNNYYYQCTHFDVNVGTLAKTHNIQITKYRIRRSWSSTTVKMTVLPVGAVEKILMDKSVGFFVKSSNKKLMSRLREYYVKHRHTDLVYVIEPVDCKQSMNAQSFFKMIADPPLNLIVDENLLPLLPKKEKSDRTVQLIELCKDPLNFQMTWQSEFYEASEVTGTGPFYYFPLRSFTASIKGKPVDIKTFVSQVENSGIIRNQVMRVFGVRNQQSEAVAADTRFELLETALENAIKAAGHQLIYNGMFTKRVARFLSSVKPANSNSLFAEISKKVVDTNVDIAYITQVCKVLEIDIEEMQKTARAEIVEFLNHYPLLEHLEHSTPSSVVKNYIDLVDSQKE
jgi:hypothetical protein